MIFKGGFLVFLMKLNETIAERFNRGFKIYLENRFYNPRRGYYVKLNIHLSDEGLEWEWPSSDIKYETGFEINDNGNLKFFTKINYPRIRSIKDAIKEKSHSANRIECSKFLARPEREYTETKYSVKCKVKKIPEKDKALYDHIFGYLMRKPMEIIHSSKKRLNSK